MRTPYFEFPEYHTSLDDLDLVTPEALAASLRMYHRLVEAFEAARTYRVTVAEGEPQLGSRGLYATTGGATDQRAGQAGHDVPAQLLRRARRSACRRRSREKADLGAPGNRRSAAPSRPASAGLSPVRPLALAARRPTSYADAASCPPLQAPTTGDPTAFRGRSHSPRLVRAPGTGRSPTPDSRDPGAHRLACRRRGARPRPRATSPRRRRRCCWAPRDRTRGPEAGRAGRGDRQRIAVQPAVAAQAERLFEGARKTSRMPSR